MSKQNISRKQALKQLGGLALGPCLAPSFLLWGKDGHRPTTSSQDITKRPAKTPKQPHIILIMTDQHRGDALGCAGNPAIKTPNIDALAREGTLFNRAYSSAPSCTPARTCLLTGMDPWHHGLLGYGRVARKYKYELPRMLGEGGYYTFGIGKNHWFPQKALHGFNGTLVDESGRIEQEGYVSDYRDWFRLQAPGEDPDKTGLGWNSRLAGPYALDEKLHPTHWTGQTAVEFIDNYNLDAPLYLKISFERPHSPYDPPQRYIDMYAGADIPAPAKGEWDGEIYNYSEDDTKRKAIPRTGPADAAIGDFGEAEARKTKKHYYASITFIDDQVGKIIAKLKERGMYDHAVICFTADHGDEMGDHYHWRKTYPYEGSVRIPCIFKWPAGFDTAVKKGSVLDAPVGLQDFLPTFLQVSGQQIPANMDGKSLLKLIRGERSGWRKYIGIEHATTYWKNNYWAAVTDGKAKYIWFFRTGQEQFFDLGKDPKESRNLVNATERKDEIALWRSRLVEYLQERGPGFVQNGKPAKRTETLLYSPHYPDTDETAAQQLKDWNKEERASFTIKKTGD
ncbi:arylsulfatase [Compostibacter hankyongensis]|uniref:Arylsulfatase n=1 Tax=Compostibacter hankyongensis TaxID=1007089 RepID=A0ABP8FJ74_9BACT